MPVYHLAHQLADLRLACQVTINSELLHWHGLVHCDTGYHAFPALLPGAPRGRASPHHPQASQVLGLLLRAEGAGQGVTVHRTIRAEGVLQ